MSKSKTNKSRKINLENFKKQVKNKKMSEQVNIPQLRQYPVWKSQETIEVSGLEWENIYNLLNLFKQGIVAGESVMQRNIEKGKIEMKYVDEQNNEVPLEKVEEYTKQLQEFFQKQQEEKSKSTIVDATGKPVKSDKNSEKPSGMKAV